MSALRTTSLHVELGGAPVLRGVDLDVEDGEWVAVVGPNGAGKSTLLRALTGLVPSSGTVTVAGAPLADLDRRARARRMALVPQNPVVPPGMMLGEYVLLGRTPHLAPLAAESRGDVERAHWALVELGLLALARRRLDEVSGGERQRAILARALAQEAPILLLDEPTSALDVGHQQEVLELIDQLRRTRGLTVLAAMHDLTLAGHYAGRLLLMDEGRVVIAGAAHEVLTAANLERYYDASVDVLDGPDGPIVVPRRPGSVAPPVPIEEVLP